MLQWPPWFLGVNKMENPTCENPPHEYSKIFPSTRTRTAFLSSRRFLTINGLPPAPPTNPGCPFSQIKGLKKWLCRISISVGEVNDPPPPNRIFSPEASRKLFVILYGP